MKRWLRRVLANRGSLLTTRKCWARLTRLAFLATAFVILSCCTTVSFDEPKFESSYITDTAQSELGGWSAQWVDAHNGASGFYPLASGMDALAARLGLAEKAQKSIDLQYFIMKGDTAGLAIFKSLLMAADRGVRIRLLLDDIWTSASDRKLVLLNEHPNIEVRLFNPVSRRGFTWVNATFDFRRANRRMHNKSFSVDNAVSIIGGRNIGDEYFELNDSAVFVDFDVLAVGPIVSEISESFDDFWNHTHAIPIENVAKPLKKETLESFRATSGPDLRLLYGGVYAGTTLSDLLQELLTGRHQLYPASARVIADSPDKLSERVGPEHQLLLNELRQLLLGAERELLVVSPYYVPLENGIQFVQEAQSRGIEMTLVTNSLASTNHVAVHSGYSKYRRDLIRAGVQLYESRADAGRSIALENDSPEQLTLHTKLVIVDRRFLVVGSPNMDPRSFEINAEKGLIIDSKALSQNVAERIMELLPDATYQVLENESGKLEWHGRIDGEKMIETSEPLASRSRRLSAWFLKIVPDRQL
ncbi:MAG: phospholipase D family protein [Gammaproteobacteria bacterium]